MPFPYLHAQVPPQLSDTFQAQALDSMRAEVRERAAVLVRLGWDADLAATRARQNLEWEFELHSPAPILAEIDALVRGVAQRS
jgi:hypothetical protein